MYTVTFFEADSVPQPSNTWGRLATPLVETVRGAVDSLHTADIRWEHWGEILKGLKGFPLKGLISP